MSRYISRSSFLTLLAFAAIPVLGGCSTAIEGATQQVTFRTVGGEDAFCNVQIGINDYRYDVRPPQSIWVQKSRKPMFVSCTAQGNRVQNLTVESGVAASGSLNLFNGGVGTVWDEASGAANKYPDEVVIDFTGVPQKANSRPSYENRDALDPKTAGGIEYMGPDVPVLPEDAVNAARAKAAYAADAEKQAAAAADDAERQRRIDAVELEFYGDKGKSPSDVKPEGTPHAYSPPKADPADYSDTGKAASAASSAVKSSAVTVDKTAMSPSSSVTGAVAGTGKLVLPPTTTNLLKPKGATGQTDPSATDSDSPISITPLSDVMSSGVEDGGVYATDENGDGSSAGMAMPPETPMPQQEYAPILGQPFFPSSNSF